MRVMASLLCLSLSSAALADTLPSFLNSNETIRNLPVPNLPADAYRPSAAPRAGARPRRRRRTAAVDGHQSQSARRCRSKAGRSTR
jgi:hypothetical protein